MDLESWKFATLVALVYLLLCYVLTNDMMGVYSTLSEHAPFMHPNHQYNNVYKGLVVALATLLSLSYVNGKVSFNEKVSVSA
jgi:hypothetical protein